MPRGSSAKNYWASMSPAERSLEMKRRMQVRQEKQNNPKRFSAAGRAATQEAQRERWRRYRQAQRSPFPQMVSLSQGSIKQRLEAIEAALTQLKTDLGF